MSNYERKDMNKEAVIILIAEQLGMAIEPICKDIGRALEAMQKRIMDLEMTVNSIVTELKQQKEQNNRTIQ